jgi:hypothetical protein
MHRDQDSDGFDDIDMSLIVREMLLSMDDYKKVAVSFERLRGQHKGPVHSYKHLTGRI